MNTVFPWGPKLKVHPLVCISLAPILNPNTFLFPKDLVLCWIPPCQCLSMPADTRLPSLQQLAWLNHTFCNKSKTGTKLVQINRGCHRHILEELIPVREVLQCDKELFYLRKHDMLGWHQQHQRGKNSHTQLIWVGKFSEDQNLI